jgi:hypothetical protein
LLARLTRDHASLTPADVAPAFNVINRLADTFGFAVGPPAAFASSARMLLKRGYRL